jgi:CHAT domain-containing protein/tetratricopeptide (TPR) repeat protein
MRRNLFGDEHPSVATALNNLAALLYHLEDDVAAEPLLREALVMDRNLFGDEHPKVATSLNNLAKVLQHKGDYAAAEPLCREALAMDRKLLGDEHPNVAIDLNGLASLLQDKGEYTAAEPHYRQALAIRRKLLGNDHPMVVSGLRGMGQLLLLRDELASADSMLTEASRSFEAARLRAGSGLDRTTFARSPYPSLALLRLRQNRPLEAWKAAEHAQARALADILLVSRERPLPPAVAACEDSLRFLLANLERKLDFLRSTAPNDSTGQLQREIEATRSELLATEVAFSSLQREIAGKFPLTEGQPFPITRVQAALPDDGALVGWLDVELAKDRFVSWAYLIRKTGSPRWTHLGATSGTSPFSRARALRSETAAPDVTQPEGPDTESFYQERLAPLVEGLEGVRSIVVVPSGAMLGLPIETLRDPEGRLLVDRFEISYVPSATLFTWLHAQARPRSTDRRPLSALLVGDPPTGHSRPAMGTPAPKASASSHGRAVFGVAFASVLRGAAARNAAAIDSLPPLVAAREEIGSLAKLFPDAEVLLGTDASEQNLTQLATTQRLSQFSVIHFATHALTDDERPERSVLVLSQQDLPDPLAAAEAGSRIYDGLLAASEVLGEWKLDAQLVTLSGCETGLGREVQGEGYVGLATAFLQAGTRSLVVSLWPVEDRSTELLMRRFYENWSGAYGEKRGEHRGGVPMGKAQALREAKRWLRQLEDDSGYRPYQHPYYWASFILMGNAR